MITNAIGGKCMQEKRHNNPTVEKVFILNRHM